MIEFVLLSTAPNLHEKIPTGSKVMTILANLQISWDIDFNPTMQYYMMSQGVIELNWNTLNSVHFSTMMITVLMSILMKAIFHTYNLEKNAFYMFKFKF